jgi:REP element-mobilizing transposase RayT
MNDERTAVPLAYHITWTAHGTWLPGDERGWVARDAPVILEPDPRRKDLARTLMVEEPVTLTPEQREEVRQTIVDHCAIRRWTLHAVNVRTTHVHVVVTADRPPDVAMNQLKAWCSRRLNERWPGRKRWWTYHGSTKWIWDPTYFAEAVDYVVNRQYARSAGDGGKSSFRHSRSGL